MKLAGHTLLLILGTSLLIGCSRDQLGKDLVKAGETVTWADGRFIYVQQRQGNTLFGIRLVQKGLGGMDRTVEAERGVISKDSNGRTVRLTLYDAVVRNGDRPASPLKEFSVICAN